MRSNHITSSGKDVAIRLTTDGPLSYIEQESTFVLTKPIHMILGPDEPFAEDIGTTCREFADRTRDFWMDWVRGLSIAYDWQDAIIRAAITLKLSNFEETGAIVAALTTSIPEAPGGGRNWDYRYCWLRDAYFVVKALNRLGATETMESFISFILGIAAQDPLRPVYGIVPTEPLDEIVAPNLKGYRNDGPVRIGNAAALQHQNDTFGSIVLAAMPMFFDRRLPRPGNKGLFHFLESLGSRAAEAAFTPDAGIWEYRSRAEVHTYSAAMCWAASSRLAAIAAHLGLSDRAAIGPRPRTRSRTLCSSGPGAGSDKAFTSAFGSEHLDASVLLLPDIGLIEPADPRFTQTVAAVESDLLRGNHVLRYANDDDFGMPDVAFLACRYWLIDAWWSLGRREEARELFIDSLRYRNRYGLSGGRHTPRHRRTLGQLSPNLLHGGTYSDRDASVAKLGGSLLARLVLVSNRTGLPQGDGTQRAGGLEVAVAPILKQIPSVWFGWSGKVVRGEQVATETVNRNNATYVVTDLARDDYEEYYNGFANRVLWPVLHYHIDLTEFTRRDLSGYLRVNRHFANELSKILRPDDLVWVHDYHLIPIADGAAAARARQCARIFPSRALPCAGSGDGAAQPRPAAASASAIRPRRLPNRNRRGKLRPLPCRRASRPDRGAIEAAGGQFVFTSRGRQTRIGNFPVGIDMAAFERLARRAVSSSFVRDVVESLSARALLIGVDRLDYSKGLIQRMDAIERFFEMYPAWRNKVTYLQIAPKSRSEIPTYSDLEQAVGAAVGRINGKYGEVAWTPIRYLNRAFGRSSLAGLYRSARVAIVTPLRDGMNLVAKEYVAAQDAEDPGVLILSRFAGAAVECEGAVLVNPYDTESVARAIAHALDMTLPERRKRHEANLAALAHDRRQ